MEELKTRLQEILAKKEEEYKTVDQDSINAPILDEEIEDVKAAIQACENGDETMLENIRSGTTSESIYDAIDAYQQRKG